MPGRAGLVQINDALVFGAAEPQRDVLLLGQKFAVHQDVQQRKHFVGYFAAGRAFLQKLFFIGIAGVAPDCLVRVQHPHIAQKRDERALVFGLERFAAEQRKPVDIIRRQAAQNRIAGGFVKRPAVTEIPGDGVEAVLAVAAAA